VALILDTNALLAFAGGDEKLLRAIATESELAIPTIVLFHSSIFFPSFAKPPSAIPRSGTN